jgi:hypothetical protein
MNVWWRGVATVALGLALLAGSVWASDEGFRPNWQVGQSWVVEATYLQGVPGATRWSEPMLWQFEVKNRTQIEGQDCLVVYITPKDRPDWPHQAIVCVAAGDLRPVKIIDLTSGREKPQARERRFNDGRMVPLIGDESLVPYTMPLFPLAANVEADEATNVATVGVQHSIVADDVTFVEEVKQSWRPNEKGYTIRLETTGSQGTITQKWTAEQPWAVESTSAAMKCRLIESR